MILRRIQQLRLDSLVLEENDAESGVFSTTVNVHSSFIQQTGNLSETDRELRNLRVRIGLAYESESAQVTDFATQRFNEYLFLEVQDNNFSEVVSENGYTDFLYRSLQPEFQQYMSSGSPYSLYASDQVSQELIFQRDDNISYTDNGTTLPQGIVLYDAGLLEVLPRDEDGNVIRRSVESTRPGVGDPDNPDPGAVVMDEEGNIAEQIEGLALRDALQNLQRVSMLPVTFDMSNVTPSKLSQLTLYMFIYEAPEQEGSGLTLGAGTTPIVSANVIGSKNIWNSISRVNPYVGIGPYSNGQFRDSRVIESPQRSQAQIITTDPLSFEEDKYKFLYDKLYKSYAGTLLDQNPEIKKIIQDKNFFTDLWVTRDHDEVPRLTFAFDIQSFLISNSAFSYFYRNPTTANILLGGDDSYDFMSSQVKDMSLYRHYVNPLSFGGINNLGTVGNLRTLGPNLSYPEEFIMAAQPVLNVTAATDPKIRFFEGQDKDIPDMHRQGASHRLGYSVKYVVEDSAPLFLREVVRRLYGLKYDLGQIFDNIVNSIPDAVRFEEGQIITNGRNIYNASLRRTTTPLNNIIGQFRGQEVSYLDMIKHVLDDYQKIIDDIIPLEQGTLLYDYYRPLLTADNVNPEVLEDIKKIIEIGIFFFIKQLRTIFPNNPLAINNLDHVVTDFESRGVCQRDYPIYQEVYTFDETLDLSTDFGYGTDYIFENLNPNIQTSGLSRISFEEYEGRINSEFEKYFQRLQPQTENIPTGNFANSAAKHFTPLMVNVPKRQVFKQTRASQPGRTLVNYDLDSYASLFSDIMHMHYDRKDLFFATPSPQYEAGYENINLESKNEQLYDSVLSILDERYGVRIKATTTPQYKSPKISEGPYDPTIDQTRYTPLGGMRFIQNGPLALPGIIGGANNLDPTIITYLETSAQSLDGQPSPDNSQDLQIRLGKRKTRKLPIKLPFAIFGELSIDKELDFVVSYERDLFNSFNIIQEMFDLTEDNIQSALDSALLNLPNQQKSMAIVSTTNNQIAVGENEGDLSYDACRPILEDSDAANDPQELISYYRRGINFPPYSQTKDPMKIYAKFLAFWMNYKQIAVVEYLDGFGNLKPGPFSLSDDFGSNLIDPDENENLDGAFTQKMKLEQWVEVTPEILNSIEQGQQLLCRVRTLDASDYQFLSQEVLKDDVVENLNDAFRSIDILNLPMYNKYFYFIKGEAQLRPIDRDLPEVPRTIVNLNPPAEDVNPPRVEDPNAGSLYGLVGGEVLSND